MPLPPTRPGQREGMTEDGGGRDEEKYAVIVYVCVCVFKHKLSRVKQGGRSENSTAK